MPEAAPDVIELSTPADADLRPMVEVAVGGLGRLLRLAEPDVEAGRAAAGAAFDALCAGAGTGPIEVRLVPGEAALVVELRRGDERHRLTVPAVPSPPG